MKNELGLIDDSKVTEQMANSVPDNNGVYLVPAFSGLGAPHWDMNRKASITGLTFDCNKRHIVRAALESIAYQIKDVIAAMEQDADLELEELLVDGGITANRFVLQFLADLLNRRIISMGMPDVSALGAAYMAGLKAGLYQDIEQLKTLNRNKDFVYPADNKKITGWYEGWKAVVTTRKDTAVIKDEE
jgi:glycerol kinase